LINNKVLPCQIAFGIVLVSCAAMPANSNSIKKNPYWSKPSSFWTPANAQKQLEEDAHQAACVRLYGGNRLWHKLTALPTYAGIIRHSQLDPEAKGILIQNKQLIRLMPSLLRSSDKVLEERNLVPAYAPDIDMLNIEMCSGTNQSGFDNAMFFWWQGKPYCYRPRIGALEMRPGNGTRFNSFIRQIARDARRHRHGVSFYHYSVYELSPT